MKIIITGGCGFIGSHLAETLVRSGYKVYIIDNFHTGSLKNIENFADQITLIKGDAAKITELAGIGIEGVFHLGIYSSSPMYKENPRLVSKVIEDMVAILEFCKKERCKLVLTSSSSIYSGNPIPWKEDMPVFVTDYYTEARYFIERLTELYNKLFGLNYVTLRLFSIYGEREEFKGRYANVLTQIIWSKIRGEDFLIYGSGEQSRDFLYVKDCVDAFISAMESDVEGIFNVGFGKSYSFKEISEMVGVEIKLAANPIKNYIYHTLADISKSKDLLNFKPKVEVEKGIKKCSSYYEKVLQF